MKYVLGFLFLLISFSVQPVQASDTKVGTAANVSGYAASIRHNLVFPIGREDSLFWKDIIETRGEARLKIDFVDGTHLWLGNDSKITIDEMVYDPGQKGQAVFTLSQGVFRMVSGAINKIQGSSFTVRTPLATIGVRGTDFWGHQTDKKLTMALLDNGELHIQTPKGNVTLTTPLSAIVIEYDKDIGQPFQLTQEQLEQAKKTIE